MGDYLFPHFLSDPQEYEQAESLWRERSGRTYKAALGENPYGTCRGPIRHLLMDPPCRTATRFSPPFAPGVTSPSA